MVCNHFKYKTVYALTFAGCKLGCCARHVLGERMPDLHADWEVVGWEHGLDEEGT